MAIEEAQLGHGEIPKSPVQENPIDITPMRGRKPARKIFDGANAVLNAISRVINVGNDNGSIQIIGAMSGTWQFQYSGDNGTTWVALGMLASTDPFTAVTTAAGAGVYFFPADFQEGLFRMELTGYSSGEPDVWFQDGIV